MIFSEKRILNILAILFENGIADEIKEKKFIDADEIHRLITQIENEYGISGRYSQEAIIICAEAFGVTVSSVDTTQELSSTMKDRCITYVQGDENEYEIVKKADGYYITKFNGFEEENMIIPSVVAGKRIKGIDQDVFKGCVLMKEIHISEGIEVIENCAFKDCKALEKVILPDTLRRIGSSSKGYSNGVFYNTGLKEITIPQNVDYLGPDCFCNCSKLEKIELSNKIATIQEYTFGNCRNLLEINLPRSLVAIDNSAFYGCSSLREVHIPIGTKKIGPDAFEGTRLKAIYIPPTVTEIDPNCFGKNGLYSRSVTIYCAAGSVAMDYGRKNNIKCAKAQF